MVFDGFWWLMFHHVSTTHSSTKGRGWSELQNHRRRGTPSWAHWFFWCAAVCWSLVPAGEPPVFGTKKKHQQREKKRNPPIKWSVVNYDNYGKLLFYLLDLLGAYHNVEAYRRCLTWTTFSGCWPSRWFLHQGIDAKALELLMFCGGLESPDIWLSHIARCLTTIFYPFKSPMMARLK